MAESASINPGLNPDLDPEALAEGFRSTGRLQIPDFLAPDFAQALREELLSHQAWRRVINGGAKVFEIGAAKYLALPAAQRDPLNAAVEAEAVHGFQFRYEVVRVPDAADVRTGLNTRLAEFTRLMSSPVALEMLAAITGLDPLVFADAQATLYRPGDFLTRHDDDVAGKHRKLAYVLGLSPEWRPEWGGLLLFNDDRDAVVEAIVPRFNALSLFTVPQPHSVSYVAPFAPVPRLSVTGWIRSETPQI